MRFLDYWILYLYHFVRFVFKFICVCFRHGYI